MIEIASALDRDDPFDIYVGIDYAFEVRRSAVKRELSGVAPSVPGAIPIAKDLLYHASRHIITPHVEFGVFRDVQLSFAVPVIVADRRELRFDQRADPCVFGGSGTSATCIDRNNSSTMRDGILPDGSGAGGMGYDARDPTTNFANDSAVVFRGVERGGVDQVHLGVAWAPMNQERDDTKPTWILGAELRLSLGKIMRFSRLDPESENGVSRGVHELRLATGIAKRTAWAEPFVFFWWQAPVGVRGSRPADPDGSLYWDVGFGQKSHDPQQRAGTRFGFEAIAYDRPAHKQRISLELAGRIEATFEGIGYSEMWEPFAYAGDVDNNPSGPLVIDPDPTVDTNAPMSHPGTTTIENYLSFGGRIGLRGQLGEHARFDVAFDLSRDQAHRISFTDAGTELPGCTSTSAGTACEDPNDDVVTIGTSEVNPLHRQIIDVVGRRYIVGESTTYAVWVGGQLLF